MSTFAKVTIFGPRPRSDHLPGEARARGADGKTLLRVAAVTAVLSLSLFAQADRGEQALLKLTIAVDGMVKSKSGAT